MSKITLEVDIKKLIAGIPIKQRIELVRELEKETWAKGIIPKDTTSTEFVRTLRNTNYGKVK